jgi:hypothetical protein
MGLGHKVLVQMMNAQDQEEQTILSYPANPENFAIWMDLAA